MLIAIHDVPPQPGDRRASEDPHLICAECDVGRACYLEPPEPVWMAAVIANKSVHVRLGETLKAFKGEPVPSATLRLVANQGAWTSRIRELRYLGWEIDTFRRKLVGGRVSSFYRLRSWQPWPPDPTGTIREYERARAQRNKSS